MKIAPLDALVSERDWQAHVIKLAHLFGWRAYHTWSSIHSAAGFPDLVLLRGTRLAFVELKTERGRVTRAQRGWLEALGQVPGVEVYLWRPSDRDRAAELLALIAGV